MTRNDKSTAQLNVLNEVDKLADRIVKSVSEAIQISSVNPKYPGQEYDKVVGGEGEVGHFMADLYREAGAEVEMVTVEPGRDNACARITGRGSGRSLLLNGHVDVVPTGNVAKWSGNPFSGAIGDGRVFGRGATDMKGGLVAHAYAAIALKKAGIALDGDLIMQSVVGEETGDHECGTTAALEAGYIADAAIVCEPTSFSTDPQNIVPTTPGLLWFSLALEGKAAHSGLRGLTIHPTLESEALGVNTIDKFWVVYQALRTLEDEWARTNRHPHFVPGYFNILPGVLRANPDGILVPFFLADTLTVEYCVYHDPRRSNEEVMAEIEHRVMQACQADTWLRNHPPVFEWKLKWAPFTAPEDSALLPIVMASHEQAYAHAGVSVNAEQSGFLGVCDLTWMERKGMQGLAYGPGVGSTAHAENEFVPIDQLIAATKTYALSVMDFCGVAYGETAEASK